MSAPIVVQLQRQLKSPPAWPCGPGVVRPFGVPGDASHWLTLRERTFAAETPAVRPWTEADFAREFLSKPWWNPRRMWLAEKPKSTGELAGAVTMALRGRPGLELPAIHWLMVDSVCRGQGFGRQLIALLETAAWHEGYREIVLETHAGWTAAVALYRSLGYQ